MSDYSRLVEIFEDLVAFHTVTGDSAAAAECLDYIEKLLVPHGLFINRYSSNGFESLVATTRQTKAPKVFLQAHLDVVPADDELFVLKREDNKLRGRGTFDMKYAAACFLNLVEELGAECAAYNFGLMLTTDEERAGNDGVRYLLEQGYSCEVCLLPDGGDNWRIESAAKGLWMVEASTTGVTSHGSRPWDGQNAADKMIDFLRATRALAPVQAHTDTTLVVTTLHAGDAYNQVPDEAKATLDIRFLSADDYASINEKLTDLARKHRISLHTEHLIDSAELDASLPQVQEWERVVSEVRGDLAPDGYALSFGASDARFFAAKGIPAIVTRPDGGGMHSDAEWIDEPGLYQFYDCVRKYVDAVALDESAATEYNDTKLPETVAAVKT